MLEAFLEYIRSEKLFPVDSRVLLAVSGGADSVAMAHLFLQAGMAFGIAHCNFKLRGEDSDEDEAFVSRLAQSWEVPFYTTSFDTLKKAETTGVSVQMAARELRYSWLETIRRENGFHYVATAHHLNDSIETIFLNLAKGCGIRGLHGIPSRNGNIVRPLLFASRSSIEGYLAAHQHPFREDASNQEDKYARNKVRLHVLPALREINPALEETMAGNLQRIRQAEYLYALSVNRLRAEAFSEDSGRILLRIDTLSEHPIAAPALLYEFLAPYGFNSGQAQQLALSLSHTGAAFYSPDYRLLVDREYLILERLPAEQSRDTWQLEEKNQSIALSEGRISLHRHGGRPVFFSSDTTEAALDAEKLAFPLLLRRWQEGDTFQPLGMGGQHQKVQDFFTNNKIARFDKEKAWILEDGKGRICWLVGYRISHRFRITADTTAYWALKFEKV